MRGGVYGVRKGGGVRRGDKQGGRGYLSRSPVASVLEMRSEPARSMRLSLALTTAPVWTFVPSTVKSQTATADRQTTSRT